jgi:hypothetical protein
MCWTGGGLDVRHVQVDKKMVLLAPEARSIYRSSTEVAIGED